MTDDQTTTGAVPTGAVPTGIAVLGSANLDLVVRQPRLPLPGETMSGESFTTVPGGKGLNQAVAAARAGARVAFLGAVGDDAFGADLRARLEGDGIDVARLQTLDVETGTAHISVVDGGENSIVIVAGANGAITRLDDADRHAIAGNALLLLQLERPLELVAEALAYARTVGVRTLLTPAPVQPLDDAVLDLVDVLLPNALEARELAGVDDDVEAAVALSRRVGLVVMTRGSQGALVARAGAVELEVPARRVEPVDTTGAGDTFVGVLAARLALGDDLEPALRAASVAASLSVTRAGASTSMPTWSEVAPLL